MKNTVVGNEYVVTGPSGGTQYLLRPSDIVIASYCPVSINIHMVRVIISRDQDAERGEWVTSKPFIHTTSPVTRGDIAELESYFAILAEAKP